MTTISEPTLFALRGFSVSTLFAVPRAAYVVIACALMLLHLPSARAQGPIPRPPAQAWSDTIGCALPPDAERLRLTLPLEVVDHLERLSGSVFVHAFLIRHFADPAAGRHRLSRCAATFTEARLWEHGTMRRNLPDARALIEALRTAERARLLTVQLADSSLSDAVRNLQQAPSPEAIEAFGAQFTNPRCDTQLPVCGSLRRVAALVDSVRRAEEAVEAAATRARQASEEVTRVSGDRVAVATQRSADSVRLQEIRATSPGETAAIAELERRLMEWKTEDSTLDARLASLGRLADSARSQQQAAIERRQAEMDTLRQRAGALLDILRNPGTQLRNASVADVSSGRAFTQLAGISTPAVQSAPQGSRVRSANVMLELVDFILTRARHEAVNAFVVNLHALARREPLLAKVFPESWELMNGLRMRPDSTLDAVDVGRVSLTVWRATLAKDFVALPMNVAEAGSGICPVAPARADSAARAQLEAAYRRCVDRIAILQPLVPAARRLLDGDAVLDVLRDSPTFIPPGGPDLPADWKRLSQAITMTAALAEVYLAQGHVPAADPARHPYLLTAHTLAQVPQRQRDALFRLLLVRAVTSAADVPVEVDETALRNGTAASVRLIERLTARTNGDSSRADALFIVQTTFDVLEGGTQIAKALVPGAQATQLDTVRARWRALSGAIEALAARDFGLAFARSTVLLRDVRDRPLPGPVVTMAALASSLAEAQTGEQVRLAFETAASPVGGWQAKRYGEGGASITAYPGFMIGRERLQVAEGDAARAGNPGVSMGGALPIGIEWQRRRAGAAGTAAPGCVLKFCNIGLFVPLIDLGTLLTYRLAAPTGVESEPNATFRQVLAPGLYISLPFTRAAPVTLLVGGQLMPSLRDVRTSTGTESRLAYRLGGGLVMDLLLLDF